MKKKFVSVAILLGFLILYSCTSKITKEIEEIFNNPGPYVNEKVQITGIVTQYYPATATTTSYYLIQGNFGGLLKVITITRPPVITKKYTIIGVVQIDPTDGRPLVIENKRIIVIPLITWILGGIVVLLLAFLIFYVLRNLRPASAVRQVYPDPQVPFSPDLQTIKIETDGPPTMIVIKGELEIISGPDKGKSFPIAGYPTNEGAVVTIGREVVQDDRKYGHIQLLEKTVSRKQAEIIYYKYNGNLLIKNLSHTNNTQVDGKILGLNESVDLRSGMIIKVGEVEFRYKV